MKTETKTTHLYKTRIDLPEAARMKSIDLLNTTLAAGLDIYTQAKQAHWNVKGKDFYQVHLLFDDLATTLFEPIDILAERITALGGIAQGTARMAAQVSIIPEYPDTSKMSETDHLTAIADRVAVFAKHIRQGIEKAGSWDDQVTNDIYVQIGREVDKKLWFIEAHLQD